MQHQSFPATSAHRADPPAPSLTLLGFEPLRAALEYAGMKLLDRDALPTGDGHPVVLFPGLAADQHAIGPLRRLCASLGYAAMDWGRGVNTGPAGEVEPWLDDLARDVDELTHGCGQRISLVGWSLGGIYAREIAKRLPTTVRQVITLGTPFAAGPESTNAALVYRLINGRPPALDARLRERLKTPPPVPTTSIYTRTDGIVSWRACLQEGDHAHCENIEVDGSHCGLCWNPEVQAVIADRLSQTERSWEPYSRRSGSDRTRADALPSRS